MTFDELQNAAIDFLLGPPPKRCHSRHTTPTKKLTGSTTRLTLVPEPGGQRVAIFVNDKLVYRGKRPSSLELFAFLGVELVIDEFDSDVITFDEMPHSLTGPKHLYLDKKKKVLQAQPSQIAEAEAKLHGQAEPAPDPTAIQTEGNFQLAREGCDERA